MFIVITYIIVNRGVNAINLQPYYEVQILNYRGLRCTIHAYNATTPIELYL